MKKLTSPNPAGRNDSLDSEYRFDYAKAKPNRFAGQPQVQPVFVQLAPDVAKVFKNGESVNAVLRSVMRALPADGTTI